MNKTFLRRSCFVLTALMFGASVWAWPQVPADASIPVHWGFDLQPDRYGGRVEGLFMMPIVGLILSVVMALAPRFAPRRENLRRSRGAYDAIRVAVLAFITMLHGAVVLEATGHALSMSLVLPVSLGLLLVAIGNLMGKLRSNHFVGVRTPWTLSSDLSWDKTNRLAGRIFVGLGGAMMVAGLLGGSSTVLSTLLGGLVAMVVVVFVYSRHVWSRDPNRRTR
ncbi:MAG: SdpI family protein [Myxococcota bacterium]